MASDHCWLWNNALRCCHGFAPATYDKLLIGQIKNMKATTATLLEPSNLFSAFSEDTLPGVGLSTLMRPIFPKSGKKEVEIGLKKSYQQALDKLEEHLYTFHIHK